VAHPQTNSQAEVANKSILYGLQKKLDDAKGKWVEELHGVLWSLRTTKKTATGETPFMFGYGSEAVLPIEVALHTHRSTTFQKEFNNVALREALNLLPSIRSDAIFEKPSINSASHTCTTAQCDCSRLMWATSFSGAWRS